MKAILYRLDSECKPVATLGNDPDNRHLTKDYRTFGALYRYAIKPALKQWDGRLKAEIWYGSNIYSEPDKVVSWNTHIFDKREEQTR